MSHYKKLEVAINQILNLSFKEQENFFVNDLVPKLQTVRDLLYFPDINHEGFKEYLELFQNDVQTDINRCICISSTNTIELVELFQLIKAHIQPKLKIVEFAFMYYLQDITQLFQNGNSNKIIRLKTRPKGSYVSTTYADVQPGK